MIEAGILDGDYALIRRAETARDGEIVVALIDDNEATLKYFRREGRWSASIRPTTLIRRSATPPARSACRASSQGCCGATERRTG